MIKKVIKIKAPLLRDAKVWHNEEKNKLFAEVVLDHEMKDGGYPRVIFSEALAEKLQGALKGEVIKVLVDRVDDNYYGKEVERGNETVSVRPPKVISDVLLLSINRKRYRAKDGIVWIRENCQGDDFLVAKHQERCLYTHEFGLETKLQFVFDHVGYSIYQEYKEKLDRKYPDKASGEYREGFKRMVDFIVDYGAKELQVKIFRPEEILIN